MNGAHELAMLKHIMNDLMKQQAKKNTAEYANHGGKITVTMTSEIPLGSGLGSSAAWGASLSAALLHSLSFLITGSTFQKDSEKEYVWAYTNFLEKLYHGRPSGCDAAVSIHGDCLFYQRAEPPGLT